MSVRSQVGAIAILALGFAATGAHAAGIPTPVALSRELLNIVQADDISCHVITVTHALLAKLDCRSRVQATQRARTLQLLE